MKIKKILTMLVLLATLLTPSAYVYSTTTRIASPATAVALGCPYHLTLSIQNNKLVCSGSAPDYSTQQVEVSLVKPINYNSVDVDASGRAVVSLDIQKKITSALINELRPKAVKAIKFNLNTNSSMYKTITASDGSPTYDYTSAVQMSLSGVPDGAYNIRIGYVGDPECDYHYNDDILITIVGGKASLQLLPTYRRYVSYWGATGWYRGYTLAPWDVQPTITPEAYDLWRRGL